MVGDVKKTRGIEVLGLISVVASLGFVALEIRQNTTAVRAATIQAVADQAMQLTLVLATDPHLPRLVREMIDGAVRADLSVEDYARLSTAMSAGLRRMENVFLQVQTGTLKEGALRRVSIGFYRNPFGRELWATARGNYDPGFAKYWDATLAAD